MSPGFLCFVGYFYLYGGIFNCNVLLRRWNLYWFGWLVCMGRVFAFACAWAWMYWEWYYRWICTKCKLGDNIIVTRHPH